MLHVLLASVRPAFVVAVWQACLICVRRHHALCVAGLSSDLRPFCVHLHWLHVQTGKVYTDHDSACADSKQ